MINYNSRFVQNSIRVQQYCVRNLSKKWATVLRTAITRIYNLTFCLLPILVNSKIPNYISNSCTYLTHSEFMLFKFEELNAIDQTGISLKNNVVK